MTDGDRDMINETFQTGFKDVRLQNFTFEDIFHHVLA
jgi:hypothetical protein